MKIKHLSPEPYTTRLEELSKGTVFRFPKSSVPYMLLPNITGDEIKAMYKRRHGSIEDMLCDIEIYDENLYIWAEDGDGDSLDEEAYLTDGEDEELIVYIRLADGEIQLSHKNEIVIPLVAELTVEDVRSPRLPRPHNLPHTQPLSNKNRKNLLTNQKICDIIIIEKGKEIII